jgi:bisanhydrobacterioruberin hydratase
MVVKEQMWWRQDPVLILIYVMMIAGAVWHGLGWFDSLMRWLSGPMLIGFGIGVLLQVRRRANLLFWFWTVLVLLLSFLMEWAGVRTGRPFGVYAYSPILQPQWKGVPLAIAFSWLMLLIGSARIASSVVGERSRLLRAFAVAVLMTVFDVVMEPAAVRLGYWSWQGGTIPLRNFFSWFVIAFLLAFAGSFMHLQNILLSRRLAHFYFAPLLYFILVLIFC